MFAIPFFKIAGFISPIPLYYLEFPATFTKYCNFHLLNAERLLKYAEEARDSAEMELRLAEVRQVLDATFDGIRRLITELRPYVLDEGELGQAIVRYAQEFEGRFGIEVDLTIADVARELPGEVASSLYRIVQEVLTNTARHAQASQISIILNVFAGNINLTIEDNGVGFDVAKVLAERAENRKYGLFGIQERVLALGGSSQIESAPGQGTTIYVKIPREWQHE